MTTRHPGLRDATTGDVAELLPLWGLLFARTTGERTSWEAHAQRWFATVVDDRETACLPVVEVAGGLVATAVGTLELGVPNPYCPRGRTVRLANLVVLPDHRRRGHGTALVEQVVGWARAIGADRVDLSATTEARSLYERAGFVGTTAPRLKLVL